MQVMDRILVAVDFDETLQAVLEKAMYLASVFNAELVLVHAVEELGDSEQAEARIEALTAKFEQANLRFHRPIVQHGRPFSVILSAANALDVNLIVLGAQQKGLAQRLLEGVTANKVMHQAVMPVWVVHPEQTSAVRHVLCAVDFSSASDQALTTAIHLARNLSATLQILHVVPHPEVVGSVDFVDLRMKNLETPASPAAHPALTSEQRGAIVGAAESFDDYLNHFDLRDLSFTKSLHAGRVYDEILHVAVDSNASLVVMGAFGRGSLVNQFMGNNADKLLRSAPCSVVTVKHQDIFKIMHEHTAPRDAKEAMADRWVEANVNELAEHIEQHYRAGREMLAKGFLEDAIVEFRFCLDRDNLFTQAYDGIAEAYERMGRHRKARHYQELARDHRRILWQQKVQVDIRRQHSLFAQGA